MLLVLTLTLTVTLTLIGVNAVRESFTYALNMFNSQTNDACMEAHPDPESSWKCFFAQYTFEHIRSRIFILEGLYDSWQLGEILGLACPDGGGFEKYGQNLSTCNRSQLQQINLYGGQPGTASYNVSMRGSLQQERG